MPRNLPHIFSRVFGAPLAILPSRIDPLLAGLRAASEQRRLLDDGRAQPVQREAGYTISENGVAVLPIHGVLVKRTGQIDAESTELQSYARVGNALARALADVRVRGVLLDVDSPGGEVGGVFELASDIRAARDVKPVWAVANDDALSAGYALASAASQVWITGVGGVGSVGVVAMHTDQSGFDAQRGFAYTYIHAGSLKVEGNPHEPLSDSAHARIQTEVDRLYAVFVDQVARNRRLDAKAVRATEAGVFYGPDALTAGLADRVGTLPQAITALGDLAASPGPQRMRAQGPEQGSTLMDEPNPPIVTADPAPAPEPAPPSAQVVQLDAVRQATANVRHEAAEIVALCGLAGMPALATEYLRQETSLHQVRTDLQRRRAEADEMRQIETIDTSPRPGPAEGGQPDEMTKVMAARWDSQMGRK